MLNLALHVQLLGKFDVSLVNLICRCFFSSKQSFCRVGAKAKRRNKTLNCSILKVEYGKNAWKRKGVSCLFHESVVLQSKDVQTSDV